MLYPIELWVQPKVGNPSGAIRGHQALICQGCAEWGSDEPVNPTVRTAREDARPTVQGEFGHYLSPPQPAIRSPGEVGFSLFKGDREVVRPSRFLEGQGARGAGVHALLTRFLQALVQRPVKRHGDPHVEAPTDEGQPQRLARPLGDLDAQTA